MKVEGFTVASIRIIAMYDMMCIFVVFLNDTVVNLRCRAPWL
jgi:hypothetical protein